jgi:hypothetical protein
MALLNPRPHMPLTFECGRDSTVGVKQHDDRISRARPVTCRSRPPTHVLSASPTTISISTRGGISNDSAILLPFLYGMSYSKYA